MTLLQATDLGYRVGNHQIFAGVDLSLDGGERLAIVGPSGSGKSTLLALLSGLAKPSLGRVLLDGRPLGPMVGPPPGVSIILQGYGLVSLLTAAENVEVALRAAGHSRADAAARTAEALGELGLSSHATQLVEELSGGQQQRTAVARALALRPRLLIADEPTAELDPASRTLALARLLEVTERGAALVLATHDPDLADHCHQILDMRAIHASAE